MSSSLSWLAPALYLNFFLPFFFILSLVLVIYTKLSLELLPLSNILFAWLSIFFFVYLLISGFVFFLKRYNYGSFTTIIASFWSSSFSIFWLLEAYLFICFIYLTLNSSSEVIYFFDYQSIFKTHLFSFSIFFFNLTLLTAIILLVYYLLGNFGSLKEPSIIFAATIVSCLVIYISWFEFLQFFHFLSFCEYPAWSNNQDNWDWSLESESSKASIVNNYVLVCVVAKFWHLIVIVLIWFFSVNSLIESSDSSESVISANLQNFIIMYLLNWISMYPWFKFIASKYMGATYTWFYTSSSADSLNHFFNGFYSILCSIA